MTLVDSLILIHSPFIETESIWGYLFPELKVKEDTHEKVFSFQPKAQFSTTNIVSNNRQHSELRVVNQNFCTLFFYSS